MTCFGWPLEKERERDTSIGFSYTQIRDSQLKYKKARNFSLSAEKNKEKKSKITCVYQEVNDHYEEVA